MVNSTLKFFGRECEYPVSKANLKLYCPNVNTWVVVAKFDNDDVATKFNMLLDGLKAAGCLEKFMWAGYPNVWLLNTLNGYIVPMLRSWLWQFANDALIYQPYFDKIELSNYWWL